jgi:hypothetical protein
VPLAEADWFYNYVAHWKWDWKQTLESFWLGSRDQVSTRLSANVFELKDNVMVKKVMGRLRRPKVSVEEIAVGKEAGGTCSRGRSEIIASLGEQALTPPMIPMQVH